MEPNPSSFPSLRQCSLPPFEQTLSLFCPKGVAVLQPEKNRPTLRTWKQIYMNFTRLILQVRRELYRYNSWNVDNLWYVSIGNKLSCRNKTVTSYHVPIPYSLCHQSFQRLWNFWIWFSTLTSTLGFYNISGNGERTCRATKLLQHGFSSILEKCCGTEIH